MIQACIWNPFCMECQQPILAGPVAIYDDRNPFKRRNRIGWAHWGCIVDWARI